jgi:hypothetical protein
MAEMFLMKTIKLFISVFCYFGTTVIYADQKLEGAIIEALKINPVLQQIILWLLIILWVVKIVWFVYEKFHLETKERKQKMRNNEHS